MTVRYFLGANSPDGFYSLFQHLLPVEGANTLYILKGGPGCGKSTLMNRLSRTAQERGEPVEEILCSGDPDSLDGVIFPRKGIALVDGTAPHVMEPRCPGAVDRYVDLGVCYDYPALAPLKEEILARKADCAAACTRATRLLKAAGELRAENRALLLTPALQAKLTKRAKGIMGREFPRRQGTGAVSHRFLDALTCRGEIHLYETAEALCPRIYLLSDRWGLAGEFLVHILAGAVENGYDAVACHDPMCPERLRHVLVPGGAAFLTVPGEFCGKPFRRLRVDAMAQGEGFRALRPRLRFSQKMAEALEEEAAAALADFKAAHDALEELYRPHSDFTKADEAAAQITKEIFGEQ